MFSALVLWCISWKKMSRDRKYYIEISNIYHMSLLTVIFMTASAWTILNITVKDVVFFREINIETIPDCGKKRM